jgi:hypothetical protein
MYDNVRNALISQWNLYSLLLICSRKCRTLIELIESIGIKFPTVTSSAAKCQAENVFCSKLNHFPSLRCGKLSHWFRSWISCVVRRCSWKIHQIATIPPFGPDPRNGLHFQRITQWRGMWAIYHFYDPPHFPRFSRDRQKAHPRLQSDLQNLSNLVP